MNIFRINNTRFRILKGGKIGLALSIGLTLLSPSSIIAQDFFVDSSYTTTDLSVPGKTISQYESTPDANATYSSDNDSIVFKPARIVFSTYNGLISIDTNGTSDTADDVLLGEDGTFFFKDGNNSNLSPSNFSASVLNLGTDGNNRSYATYKVTPNTVFTVTVQKDKNVTTISKSSTVQQNYNSTSNSASQYDAQVIFEGNNTVSDNINLSINNGNTIEIKGNVDFNGTVKAYSTIVNTTGDVNFDKNVNSTYLTINQASDVEFNENFNGILTVSENADADVLIVGNVNGQIIAYDGNVSVQGDMSGNIHSSGGIVNLNNGISGNINFADNGQVKVISGDISGDVTGRTDKGTLILDKNTSTTISGDVGNIYTRYQYDEGGKIITPYAVDYYYYTSSSKIGEITLGSGDLNASGRLLGSSRINFNEGDATINLAGDLLTDTITTDINNTGTINVLGTNNAIDLGYSSTAEYVEIEGDIGTAENQISELNLANYADDTKLTGQMHITDINVHNSSDIILSGTGSELHSQINLDHNNTNSFISIGSNQYIKNDVGSNDKVFESFEIGKTVINSNEEKITTIGGITVDGDIYASDVKFIGESSLTIGEGKKLITNSISADSNESATLTLAGGTQTIDLSLGIDNGNRFKTINAGQTSDANSTFLENIDSKNINIGSGIANFDKNVTADSTTVGSGTANFNIDKVSTISSDIVFSEDNGTINLYNGLTGDINFQNYDASVNLVVNKIIDGNITGQNGTVNFEGSNELTGSIGSESTSIKELNLNTKGLGSDLIGGDIYAENINFNHDTNLTLNASNVIHAVQINTDVNNTGTLLLGGNNTVTGIVGSKSNILKEIQAGNSSSSDVFNNMVFTDKLKFDGNGTVRINDTLSGGTSNAVVDFQANDGRLEIANGDLNATFIHDNDEVTLEMVVGTQSINGEISDSTHLLKKLEIGDNSDTTSHVDIYATQTVLGKSNSTLTLMDDKSITSEIKASSNNNGTLKLNGGVQTVTGDVGESSKKLLVVDSGQSQNSVSTFNGDVNAQTIVVNEGTTNFIKGVEASMTKIGSGTANFNTNNIDTTRSSLNFTNDNGTANLHTGLVGDIDVKDKSDISVNLWDNQTITGNIKSTGIGSGNGTLTFKGAGVLTGNIGSSISDSVKVVNLNTEGATSSTVSIGGNIYAQSININSDANLILAASKVITDIDATAKIGTEQLFYTNVNNTGTIELGGDNIVTGVVGSANKIINTIKAGKTSKTDTFNNMVYVNTMKVDGDGTIILNGQSGVNSAHAGLKGTIDFDNHSAELQIGDNVNISTGYTGLNIKNAEHSVLKFNGNSTITGVVGGNTTGKSTFASIYAGTNGSTVSFKDNVSVSKNTFHVSDTGTVNFEGDLNGPMIYNGNGTVNISNNKSIKIKDALFAVRTDTHEIGTLNYLGGTTLADTSIGESSKYLKEVNFNTSSNQVHQTISHDVYASNTHIGGDKGINSLNLIDVNGLYDYAGAEVIKEFRGGTAMTIDSNIILGKNVTLHNSTTGLNIGTSRVSVGNNLTLNNAGISATVNTLDITGIDDAGSTTENSGYISVAKDLKVTGNEKFHINYVGSLSDTGTYTLIDAETITGNYFQKEIGANQLVTDNSFSIDTKVYTENNKVVVAADRTNGGAYEAKELYVVKSDTSGHFSNNAAKALANISAQGNQHDDMVEVIQKFELDSFGYGDTKEKLAKQVKKLAPIANNSLSQASLSASDIVIDTIGSRIDTVRGMSAGDDTLDKSIWGKVMSSTATQDQLDMYNGYELSSNGLSFGLDKIIKDNTIIGASLGYLATDVTQSNPGNNDQSDVKSVQASIYGSHVFGEYSVEGQLGYAMHSTTGHRETAIDRTANYDIDAKQIQLNVTGAYNYNYNDIKITPSASLNYSMFNQDAYTETGAGALNLSVESESLTRGSFGIGTKIEKDITISKGTYTPQLRVGIDKYFGDNGVATVSKFEQGASFTTESPDMMSIMYTVGAGIKTKVTDTVSISLDTNFKQSDTSYSNMDLQLSTEIKF